MISQATLRQWFPPLTPEQREFERRLRLRRNHRYAQQELHGRGKC